MRATGANVVVRYLTDDDRDQSARARAAVDGGAVLASTTVLLESDWLLRSVYSIAPEALAAVLRAFAGLPGIAAEIPGLVAEALDRGNAGMNFADALHLVAAARCDAKRTFDVDSSSKPGVARCGCLSPEGK